MRIQKLNAQPLNRMKNQEYELLDAIAKNSLVTQAGLAARLGIAVGSVNWYIKRLINRGYISLSHLDRTRLKYHLTPEGMKVLTQRSLIYMKNSLRVYNELRQKAKAIVTDLMSRDIPHAFLDGNDEMIDILRLTCIEKGMTLDKEPNGIVLTAKGNDYQVVFPDVIAL